ncbi:fumarate reductase subunit C [Microbacterium resistens]|uniref:Fumarate reductase subunit C n=1 Tax=Microbacterium resistens TaxID=156977 RepID=A0ABU1S8S6_9MICO|nr:FtsX-like permease family protein [Microbacterium resistens]MDR6865965.1 fumarate reductase subunit C [Microbacterium resistens]
MNRQVLTILLRPVRGQSGVVALPIVAFGVVTALVLTVLGGAQTFWTWQDDLAPIYVVLAAIALVLLIVPLLGLGGAAARLSARRRDERLSTLRLLGVTPGGVTIATVVESALVAALGALAGMLCYFAMTPLIGLIPFRGQPLGVAAVILPAWQILAVLGGVVLLAALSAVVGLRRVVISPLGVRMRAQASPAHWIRAVVLVVVMAAGIIVSQQFAQVGGIIVFVILVGAFAFALAMLNLVGPWMLKVVARSQLRRAERPDRLLSARIVLDSPKAAWRQVSGISMASFMAVFAGTGVALMADAASSDINPEQIQLVADMRTGLIITLVASFLMVAASVGVNQASAILDQRELNRSLHFLGMPMETVDGARRRAIMSPLLVTALGSAICAGLLIFPLLGMALILAPLSLLTIAAVLATGIGLVWIVTRLTRPILAREFAG